MLSTALGPALAAIGLAPGTNREPAVRTIRLNFGGDSDVDYAGPIEARGVSVAPFSAVGAGLEGREAAIERAVISAVAAYYAPMGVMVSAARPVPGADHATVYVGAADDRLPASRDYLGLAEGVGGDVAFVLTDRLDGEGWTFGSYVGQLSRIVAHEAGHLLGFEHPAEVAEVDADDPLKAVGYSTTVHEWVARQGYDLFKRQFGVSAMDAHAAVFTQAAINEDLPYQNPFGEGGGLNHPSLKHFWAHGLNYGRSLTDGLYASDSAPNRSLKYLSQVSGGGAVGKYAGDPATAFDYLGHAAHLLADMSVPSHAHADPHLEDPITGANIDPDPYHDWVDGRPFSYNVFDTGNVLRISTFKDPASNRWEWYGIPNDDGRNIPSAAKTGVFPRAAVLDLYTRVANLAATYDTVDYVGSSSPGARGRMSIIGAGGLFQYQYSPAALYATFGRAELDAMANTLVPTAIRSTAELIRYFFASVDDEKPSKSSVILPQFTSKDPDKPQVIPQLSFYVNVAATDQDTGDSGIGKDKFQIQYREKAPNGAWTPWRPMPDLDQFSGEIHDAFSASAGPLEGKGGALIRPIFRYAMPDYEYGFRAKAEDGAGNVSDWSDEYYVKVGGGSASMLVVDVSGSMASAGKMNAAKQAASTFVNLQREGDSIGVVAFSSGASLAYPLTPVSATSDARAGARGAIASLYAGGVTSIGAGLGLANSALGHLEGKRAIVVMSDGQENQSPYAMSVLSQVPQDVLIFSIGFGSDADAAVLSSIAQARGGRYYYAASNADLEQIYVAISGSVAGDQDVLNQNGNLTNGQQAGGGFQVDPTTSSMTIGLQWPGSDMDLSLIAPDGTVITRDTNDPRVRFIGGSTSEFFQILTPAPGLWRAVVDAIDVDSTGEAYQLFARLSTPIRAGVAADKSRYDVGDRAAILVTLDDETRILGAAVTGVLTPPGGSSAGAKYLTFLDDGLHGDGAAGDGVYGALVYLGHAGAGAYELNIEAVGTTSSGVAFTRRPSIALNVAGAGASDANNPPILGPIADRTAYEGLPISLTARATDPDRHGLTFSLDPGAPAGATIDPVSGVFTWTPPKGRGGDSFAVTIRVADAGSPSESAMSTFTINVLEVNSVPTIAEIADQVATPGVPLTLTAVGVDPDAPGQALTFGLGADAPAGATIDPTTGLFSWTPTADQIGTHQIVVWAVGSGSSSMIGATMFQVVVSDAAPPVVESIRMWADRLQPVHIEVAFSKPLETARALNPLNYVVIDPGRDRRFGTRDDRRIGIREVAHDATTRRVVLTPARPIGFRRQYQLIVVGSGRAGVADAALNLLDGDRDGVAGGDYATRFTRPRPVFTARQPVRRAPLASNRPIWSPRPALRAAVPAGPAMLRPAPIALGPWAALGRMRVD